MKVSEFAKEIGKSPMTVYRMIERVEQETENCLTTLNGNVKEITEAGQQILRDRFGSVKQNEEQMFNSEEQPLNGVKHPNSEEIEFLREQVNELRTELKEERKHSQSLANKLADLNLVEKRIELARLEEKTQQPALLAEAGSGSAPAEGKKRSLLSRIFHRGN